MVSIVSSPCVHVRRSCWGSPSCVPAGSAYGGPRGTVAPRLRLPVAGQGRDDHRAGREALAPQGLRSPQGRSECPTRSWEASATSHLRRAFQGRRTSGSRLRTQGRKHGYVLDDVRRTARADTMARRTRHNGLLAFPAEVPLTPGTLDQEVALPQREELLAKLTILRLEREKPEG